MVSLIFALALAGEAQPPILDGVVWAARPGPQDFLAVYPRNALRKKLPGRAAITCTATAEGRLTDCTVKAEQPEDMGFGAAALKLAPRFRLKPPSDGSSLEGGVVTVPLFWTPSPSSD